MSDVYWQYCSKCKRPTNHTYESGCLKCPPEKEDQPTPDSTPPSGVSVRDSLQGKDSLQGRDTVTD